jgi:hypothetical protein
VHVDVRVRLLPTAGLPVEDLECYLGLRLAASLSSWNDVLLLIQQLRMHLLGLDGCPLLIVGDHVASIMDVQLVSIEIAPCGTSGTQKYCFGGDEQAT